MGHTAGETAAPRVLLVDDEPSIRDLVSATLRLTGFDVRAVGTGRAALAALQAEPADLLVLDVMLPDMDGFEVTRRLRERGRRTPVVFLTARDATEDTVTGLTVGGDDYLTKPFSLEELVARIRAVLRRTSGLGDADAQPSVLTFADVELDEDSHEVRRAGELVDLSPTEFNLLMYLMENQGRVLSKAQILDHVWTYDFRGVQSIVESYVSYLRRKLDVHGPSLIHTVRGVGYVLRMPREA